MRNKKVPVTSANKLFLIFVVLFLSTQLVLTFMSAILRRNFVEDNMYLLLAVNEYIIILLPVLLYAVIKKLDFKEVFRFNKLGIKPAILIVAMSIPAYFAASLVNTIMIYILQFLGNVPQSTIPVPQNIPELITGLFMVALSPAICEEMLNRGIMLKAYENRGSVKAVIITSIFFGIFHFDITNLLGPIFLGLLIGYYAIRTNSIFAAMLAHFMNNAFAEVISYIYRYDFKESQFITVTFDDLGISFVYGIVGIIVIFVLLKLFNRVTEHTAVIRPPIAAAGKDVISIITQWPVIIILSFYLLFAGLYIVSIFFSGMFY